MMTISFWIDDANSIAKAFRLGAYQQAGEPLANFVNRIALLPESTATTKMPELVQILNELLKCHKSCDWLGVADYLEFELVNWLRKLQSNN
jgi:hypothetical protein